jgi:hypothetical protein
VTSYQVYWDEGIGSPLSFLMISTNLTQALITNNIQSGFTYVFTVAAVNIIGTGPQSSSISLKAAEAPAKMTSVAIS